MGKKGSERDPEESGVAAAEGCWVVVTMGDGENGRCTDATQLVASLAFDDYESFKAM